MNNNLNKQNLNEEGFFGTYGGSFIPAELKKKTAKSLSKNFLIYANTIRAAQRR